MNILEFLETIRNLDMSKKETVAITLVVLFALSIKFAFTKK